MDKNYNSISSSKPEMEPVVQKWTQEVNVYSMVRRILVLFAIWGLYLLVQFILCSKVDLK